MIVRTLGGTLQLITQPDHAHLAERIMSRCDEVASHPRHGSIRRAIREHDNGWTEEDAAPTVNPESGEVVDFINAPAPVRQGVWRRGIDRLAGDPWAAALVAQHAITVYGRYRTDSQWLRFFSAMEAMRDRLLLENGGTFDLLLADYAWVRLGDLISLVFCTRWTEVQRFGRWAVSLDGTHVLVQPDLFGGRDVPFEITATELQASRFRSDAELKNALSAASTVVLRGTAAGSRK